MDFRALLVSMQQAIKEVIAVQIAYRAKDLTEAHIVAGFFQARGIDCHVEGTYLQGGMGEIGTSGFTNVHVENEDFPRAREAAEEYEQLQNTTDTATAPATQSRVTHLSRLFLIACAVVIGVLWLL